MRAYLRSFLNWESFWQMIRLGIVGTLNTIVYFVLLNVFLGVTDLTPVWSVTAAFALATFVSYVLNRRWTFRLDAARGSAGETVSFFAVSLASWGVTVALVKLAEWWLGDLSTLEVNLVNLVAAAFIVLPKFALYRDMVFRKSLEQAGKRPAA